MLRLLYYILQILWLKVGRAIFRGAYQSVKMLDPYEKFADDEYDVFVRAKRDFSFYNNFIDFSGNRLLDVGSGSGKKTTFYSLKSGEAIGVDIGRLNSREAHHFTKEQKIEQIDFVVAEGGHLPFKQHSFDIVISNDALEHFKDWRQVISEMERMVKGGGYICINFGPLWLSPFGSHMDFNEYFSPPWAHLIFSEETIKRVLISFGKIGEIDRDNHLFMHHLNRITVAEFKATLKDMKFNVKFIKLRTVSPFGPLLKTPLREFFTTGVIAILERTQID